MKSKIIFGILIIVIALAAIWNLNISSNEKGLSDVLLANVEALAISELTGNCPTASTLCQFNCKGCGTLLGTVPAVNGNASNLSGNCPNCGTQY